MEGCSAWAEEAREGLLEGTHGLGACFGLVGTAERWVPGGRVVGCLACRRRFEMVFELQVLSDVSAFSELVGLDLGCLRARPHRAAILAVALSD